MVSLKSILVEMSSLSPTERAELLAKLQEQIALEAEAEDVAIGKRGLAAWTGSVRDESWEEFYPEELRMHPRGQS